MEPTQLYTAHPIKNKNSYIMFNLGHANIHVERLILFEIIENVGYVCFDGYSNNNDKLPIQMYFTAEHNMLAYSLEIELIAVRKGKDTSFFSKMYLDEEDEINKNLSNVCFFPTQIIEIDFNIIKDWNI